MVDSSTLDVKIAGYAGRRTEMHGPSVALGEIFELFIEGRHDPFRSGWITASAHDSRHRRSEHDPTIRRIRAYTCMCTGTVCSGLDWSWCSLSFAVRIVRSSKARARASLCVRRVHSSWPRDHIAVPAYRCWSNKREQLARRTTHRSQHRDDQQQASSQYRGSNDQSCGGEPSVKGIGGISPFCLAAKRVSTRDTTCGSFGAISATTYRKGTVQAFNLPRCLPGDWHSSCWHIMYRRRQ
jgi:hypothetical protein